MSNQPKVCPSCGEIIEDDELYCPSCGERLVNDDDQPSDPVPAAETERRRNITTNSGRTNVAGDNIVNAQDQSTTNNVDNSRTSNTVNNVQKTSNTVNTQQTVGSIDNSQQVVNNITIIGGAGMTLPGGFTIPASQPSTGATQQPAYQAPSPKSMPQQEPQRRQPAPASKAMPDFEIGMDADGNPVIREPRRATPSRPSATPHSAPAPKSNGGGMGKWILVAAIVAIVAVVAIFSMGGGSKEPVATEAAPTEQTVAPATEQAVPATKPSAAPKTDTKPAAAPKTDANYEAGMKAYNEGNGLEAVRMFQASGSAQSNYMLGIIYKSGCGTVEKNAMKARTFFKKAAKQGSAEAQAELE